MNYNAISYVEKYHDDKGVHFITMNCEGLPIYDYYDEHTTMCYEYDDQGRSIYRKDTSEHWPTVETRWKYSDNGIEIYSTDSNTYENFAYYDKNGKLYASRIISFGCGFPPYETKYIYFDNGYMCVEDNLDHQLYEYDNQGRIIRMKDNDFEKIYTYYGDGSIGYKNIYLKTGEVVNESHTVPKKLNNLGLGEI